MSERISGVGIFAVKPDNTVLTIQELTNKKTSQKKAGERSIPMETVKRGETFRDALVRLTQEEVSSSRFGSWESCFNDEICMVNFGRGVWLHIFRQMVPMEAEAILGSRGGKEIDNPLWEPLSVLVRYTYDAIRLGVWAGIISHINHPYPTSSPDIYYKRIVSIPDEICVRSECRVNPGLVLSQPAFLKQQQSNYLV